MKSGLWRDSNGSIVERIRARHLVVPVHRSGSCVERIDLVILGADIDGIAGQSQGGPGVMRNLRLLPDEITCFRVESNDSVAAQSGISGPAGCHDSRTGSCRDAGKERAIGDQRSCVDGAAKLVAPGEL